MLSSAERTARPPKPLVAYDYTFNLYGRTLEHPVDVVTITKFPNRAAHAKLLQSVRPAARLNSTAHTQDDRMKRIMREVCCLLVSPVIYLTNPQLKAVTVDPHPQIDVYVNDSDISFFKIVLEVRPFKIVFDFAYNVYLPGTNGRR